jgi:hypothetical protein
MEVSEIYKPMIMMLFWLNIGQIEYFYFETKSLAILSFIFAFFSFIKISVRSLIYYAR